MHVTMNKAANHAISSIAHPQFLKNPPERPLHLPALIQVVHERSDESDLDDYQNAECGFDAHSVVLAVRPRQQPLEISEVLIARLALRAD